MSPDSRLSSPPETRTDVCAPEDPLHLVGLNNFARGFRSGEFSSEQVTRAYLDRIALLNPSIGAYSAVDSEGAIRTAREIDHKRDRGLDLGPLMGIPVAIKEIIRVEGLPFGAGTAIDLSDITPAEGPFIRTLKAQGAVVLGLTRTTEFAAATINLATPVAWNPWDSTVKRVCGGSSHGSAVSLAAGLCGLAIGSDTGGSVRLPAALCGTVGLKPSKGWCPIDGIFPLAPTFDTVGLFTRSVDDASFAFAALTGQTIDNGTPSKPLRFARPRPSFDGLDRPVASAVEEACTQLSAAGVEFVDVELPWFDEALQMHAHLVASQLVLYLGRERLIANRERLDPVTWSRVEAELSATPDVVTSLKARKDELISLFLSNTAELDAVLTPTTPISPGPASELDELAKVLAWNHRSGRNTRPGNLLDRCGISIPVPYAAPLPVGLQLLLPHGRDVRLLQLARFVENIVGKTSPPTLSGFLSHRSRDQANERYA